MTDPAREQLKRDCADARSGPSGPRTASMASCCTGALRDGQDNAITWHLIHVLETLEQET